MNILEINAIGEGHELPPNTSISDSVAPSAKPENSSYSTLIGSVIVTQAWPWTELVNPNKDETVYRNEIIGRVYTEIPRTEENEKAIKYFESRKLRLAPSLTSKSEIEVKESLAAELSMWSWAGLDSARSTDGGTSTRTVDRVAPVDRLKDELCKRQSRGLQGYEEFLESLTMGRRGGRISLETAGGQGGAGTYISERTGGDGEGQHTGLVSEGSVFLGDESEADAAVDGQGDAAALLDALQQQRQPQKGSLTRGASGQTGGGGGAVGMEASLAESLSALMTAVDSSLCSEIRRKVLSKEESRSGVRALRDSFQLFHRLRRLIQVSKENILSTKASEPKEGGSLGKAGKVQTSEWRRRQLLRLYSHRSSRQLFLPYGFEEPIKEFAKYHKLSERERQRLLDQQEAEAYRTQLVLSRLDKTAKRKVASAQNRRLKIENLRERVQGLEEAAAREGEETRWWSWSSWLENAVFENHLLEAAMQMQTFLPVRSRNIRDLCAFPGTQPRFCCPQSLGDNMDSDLASQSQPTSHALSQPQSMLLNEDESSTSSAPVQADNSGPGVVDRHFSKSGNVIQSRGVEGGRKAALKAGFLSYHSPHWFVKTIPDAEKPSALSDAVESLDAGLKQMKLLETRTRFVSQANGEEQIGIPLDLQCRWMDTGIPGKARLGLQQTDRSSFAPALPPLPPSTSFQMVLDQYGGPLFFLPKNNLVTWRPLSHERPIFPLQTISSELPPEETFSPPGSPTWGWNNGGGGQLDPSTTTKDRAEGSHIASDADSGKQENDEDRGSLWDTLLNSWDEDYEALVKSREKVDEVVKSPKTLRWMDEQQGDPLEMQNEEGKLSSSKDRWDEGESPEIGANDEAFPTSEPFDSTNDLIRSGSRGELFDDGADFGIPYIQHLHDDQEDSVVGDFEDAEWPPKADTERGLLVYAHRGSKPGGAIGGLLPATVANTNEIFVHMLRSGDTSAATGQTGPNPPSKTMKNFLSLIRRKEEEVKKQRSRSASFSRTALNARAKSHYEFTRPKSAGTTPMVRKTDNHPKLAAAVAAPKPQYDWSELWVNISVKSSSTVHQEQSIYAQNFGGIGASGHPLLRQEGALVGGLSGGAGSGKFGGALSPIVEKDDDGHSHGVSPMLSLTDEAVSSKPLSFETALSTADFDHYKCLLAESSESPWDSAPLLELSQLLLSRGLPLHALSVLCSVVQKDTNYSSKAPGGVVSLLPPESLRVKMIAAKLSAYCLGNGAPLQFLRESLIQASNKSLPRMLALASVAYCLGREDEACSILEDLLQSNPSSIDVLRSLSLLKARSGDLLSRPEPIREALRLHYRILAIISVPLGPTTSGALIGLPTHEASNPELDKLSAVDKDVLHLEHAWLQEFCQGDVAAITKEYEAVKGESYGGHHLSIAHTALGRMLQSRGQYEKALERYRRALVAEEANPMTYLLAAMCNVTGALSSAVSGDQDPGSFSASNIDLNLEQVDSQFRRGLLLLGNKDYKWAALLAYASFCGGLIRNTKPAGATVGSTRVQLVCYGGDCKRVEEALWCAVDSCSSSQYHNGGIGLGTRIGGGGGGGLIWTTIALAHFYQYTRSRPNIAAAVLVLNSAHNQLQNDKYRDGDDVAGLLVAQAYLSLETGRERRAVAFATEALKQAPGHPSAVRFLAISLWQKGYRAKALDYMLSSVDAIERKPERMMSAGHRMGTALKVNRHKENPYYLRTVGVMQALLGHWESARATLLAALAAAPTHRLTLQAVAVLTYLLGERGSKKARAHSIDGKRQALPAQDPSAIVSTAHARCIAAIKYLDRSLALCPEDVEALRLKAQMLMELGKFDIARVFLKKALALTDSGDAVCLASLALCADAVRKKILANLDKTEVDKKTRAAVRALEVPSDVFEEAMLIGQTGSQRSLAGSKDGDDFSGAKVPSDVIYWYGLFCLQADRGRTIAAMGKSLIFKAVQRHNAPPHPLSLYTLGWLEEKEGDLEAAERYYELAIRAGPTDLVTQLRLESVAKDTATFVRGLLRSTSQSLKKVQKRRRKLSRQRAEKAVTRIGRSGLKYLVPLRIPEKSINSNNERTDIQSTTSMVLAYREKAEDAVDNDGTGDDVEDEDREDSVAEKISLEEMELLRTLSELEQRDRIHARVLQALEGAHSDGGKKQTEDIFIAPGKFVYIDPFLWDRLFAMFSECDDWAWLYKSRRSYRKV